MKLYFHGATTMTSSLETDVEASKLAGFTGLEVWASKLDHYLSVHSMAELSALFSRNGIFPMVLNSIEFIGFRGNDYHQIQSRCQELSIIARAIGCPAIAVVPSPIPDHKITWNEIVMEYVKVLRDMGKMAAGYGINLAFEPLGFGWCTVRTPRGAWEIIQKTGMENVGMILDAAHFHAGGGLLSELDELDTSRIFGFHIDDLEDCPKEAITDATRVMPGDGVVPLAAICEKLSRIGYDGHCSVELFRPEYWELDPAQVAIEAREKALKVLSPYFSME